MREMERMPHSNRYRDVLSIPLGIAAGTTGEMMFGFLNVEKKAKRTKDYVKK